jgi:hypothetical protein
MSGMSYDGEIMGQSLEDIRFDKRQRFKRIIVGVLLILSIIAGIVYFSYS